MPVLQTTALSITLCLSAFYISFFVLYLKHWKSLPYFENLPEDTYQPHTFISILIPARNEEDNIIPCLQSIFNINYPKHLFEVIVIDDHSTDKTPQYVKHFQHANLHLVELHNHVQPIENQPFKKKAIEAAIGTAKGTLIVTTDGDCVVQPDWLNLIAAFYETQGKRFIAAPVNFHEENSFFERFQSLDYIGMMGITGAGVQGRFTNMCNGANLAYEKELFYEVGGFKDIDHVASGDDMLLMQKVAKHYPTTLGFLKNPNATVFTKAKPTVKDFFQQRLRWASKSSSYTEFFTVFQLVAVFLFCFTCLVNLFLGLFYDYYFLILVAIQLSVKIIFDYMFLNILTKFFKRTDLMPIMLRAQILHVLYIVVVGLSSNIKKKYVWKGRVVR